MTEAERLTALEQEMERLRHRLDDLVNPPASREEMRELAQMTLRGDRYAVARFNRLRRLRKRQAERP